MRDNMPDDTDGTDEVGEFRAWELREMRRLRDASHTEVARGLERADVERRRKLTDEQRATEDAKERIEEVIAHQVPPGRKVSSRYYHKGAFYVDEESLEASEAKTGRADPRRRDLTQFATGLEKELNQDLLPEFMQGKRYGVKNSSTRARPSNLSN